MRLWLTEPSDCAGSSRPLRKVKTDQFPKQKKSDHRHQKNSRHAEHRDVDFGGNLPRHEADNHKEQEQKDGQIGDARHHHRRGAEMQADVMPAAQQINNAQFTQSGRKVGVDQALNAQSEKEPEKAQAGIDQKPRPQRAEDLIDNESRYRGYIMGP